MLVLTRRPNETIVLPGPGVTIRVLSSKNNAVRVGIEAPPDIAVLRGELHDRRVGQVSDVPHMRFNRSATFNGR